MLHLIRLESIMLKFLPIMLFGISPIFCLLCLFLCCKFVDYAALFSCRKGVLIMILPCSTIFTIIECFNVLSMLNDNDTMNNRSDLPFVIL